MPKLPDCCYALPGDPPGKQYYAAYNHAGENPGLNFQGDPCPTWGELPQNIHDKWEAVAAAARSLQVDTDGKTSRSPQADLKAAFNRRPGREINGNVVMAHQAWDCAIVKAPEPVDEHYLLGVVQIGHLEFHMHCYEVDPSQEGTKPRGERRAHPDMDPARSEELDRLWHVMEPDACFRVMPLPDREGLYVVILTPFTE